MKKVKDAIRVITCRKSAYEGLEQKVEKLNPLITDQKTACNG